VLLDINLPDVHGFDVLDEIRHYDPRVIVVCVSGSGSAQVATDAMRAGAHDYVSKPLRLSELKILLETRLSQRERVVDGMA
jgi:DNA-binding NtrC family response regulator